MILIGDLYQLPPVVKREEWQFFRERYPHPYFFASAVVRSGMFRFKYWELEKVYRQEDQHFLSFLERIRTKQLNAASLALINQQVISEADQQLPP